MSRIFTIEELTNRSLSELYALYREFSELSRSVPTDIKDADTALANLQVIATAIRIKQAAPKPPGF